MANVETENGAPERIGRVIGETLAALIAIAVIVMMVLQFA